MNRALMFASALTVAVASSPALAVDVSQYTEASTARLKDNPDAIHTTLHRSVFDQVGPSLDIQAMCGPAGAKRVEVKRNAWQVLATIASIGFYTPTRAHVLCNQPGAPPSMTRTQR